MKSKGIAPASRSVDSIGELEEPASVSAPSAIPSPTRTAPDAAEPLYLKVARGLIRDIGAGQFSVGSLLPPETELAQFLGVSRQTVRQALSELREMGLISAKRGVGTRVDSARPSRRFNYSSRSVDDLINFASDTRLSLVSRNRFTSSDAIEANLGIPSGARWMHYGCLRKTIEDGRPFCWTDIYLDAKFSDLVGRTTKIEAPIFSRIEERERRKLSAINQGIRAVTLAQSLAKRLSVDEGMPGLQVIRSYFLEKKELFEISINTIPSDRYQFFLELDLNR